LSVLRHNPLRNRLLLLGPELECGRRQSASRPRGEPALRNNLLVAAIRRVLNW